MSFTRFNYDEARTFKKMQESTGPGRYLLNTPDVIPKGQALPSYSDDPHIRLQGWGGNLRESETNLDIDSYLLGYYNRNTHDLIENPKIKTTKLNTESAQHTTDETRSTNPPREYRSIEVNRFSYLHENPQKHYRMLFSNNIDSREMAKKEYLHK